MIPQPAAKDSIVTTHKGARFQVFSDKNSCLICMPLEGSQRASRMCSVDWKNVAQIQREQPLSAECENCGSIWYGSYVPMWQTFLRVLTLGIHEPKQQHFCTECGKIKWNQEITS